MQGTNRRGLGVTIGIVILLLALGLWMVIDALPDEPEPYGYGPGGIAFVFVAFIMSTLFDMLLVLLIAWSIMGQQDLSSRFEQMIPVKSGLTLGIYLAIHLCIMLILGWIGAYLALIGIVRYWDWIIILVGVAILLIASIAARLVFLKLQQFGS